MTAPSIRARIRTMKHINVWEIFLSVLFPGIGQIVHGRWRIGIPFLVLNGLTLYLFWIILMPISLGMLLHDRRE